MIKRITFRVVELITADLSGATNCLPNPGNTHFFIRITSQNIPIVHRIFKNKHIDLFFLIIRLTQI